MHLAGVEIHTSGIHLTRERNLGHVALPGSESSLEAAQPACRPSVFEDSVPQVATRRLECTKAWGRAAALGVTSHPSLSEDSWATDQAEAVYTAFCGASV